MKKLISYSLWGNNPKYTVGAIKNANLARKFYPGWVCRFYCTNDVPSDTIKILQDLSEVVICDDKPDWKFATKRFLPMSEQGIERIIFRDTDGRFTEREVAAVNQWIENDDILHVMRDHPFHTNFPILAGMFGIKGGYVDDIGMLLKLVEKHDSEYHYDQKFLFAFIWSLFKNQCTVHDEFLDKKPFPTARNGNLEFVGEPFNADDSMCEPMFRRILSQSI